jgi:hypothetical protein
MADNTTYPTADHITETEVTVQGELPADAPAPEAEAENTNTDGVPG